MFRFLLLLGLCSFILPMVVLAAEPKRTLFTYVHKGEGKGTIKHTDGSHWVENGPLGEVYKFEEVARNKEYIEIYDKDRKVAVRIFATHYKWNHPEKTKGKWEGGLDGKWTE